MTERRPFDMVDPEPIDEHVVDATVARRMPMKKLRKRIHGVTTDLVDGLGERKHLWLRLEELLGKYHARREEAYFDLGYEHGAAAGLASALRVLTSTAANGPAYREARVFAETVRDMAVRVDLPRSLTVATLLETAWALALGLPEHDDTNTPKKDRE